MPRGHHYAHSHLRHLQHRALSRQSPCADLQDLAAVHCPHALRRRRRLTGPARPRRPLPRPGPGLHPGIHLLPRHCRPGRDHYRRGPGHQGRQAPPGPDRDQPHRRRRPGPDLPHPHHLIPGGPRGSPPGRLRHGPPPTVGLLPRRRLLRRPGAPHPAGVAVLHGRRRRHYVVAGRLRTHDLRVDAGLPGLPPGTDHAGPGVALHPRTAPSRRAEECRAPGRGAGGGPRPPARVCPAAPLGPSPSCSS